jgi:alpha-1,2-mannosyltransferase
MPTIRHEEPHILTIITPRPAPREERHWLLVTAGLLVGALLVIARESGADFAQDYAAAWAWWHGMHPSTPTASIFAACCPQDYLTGAYQTAHPPFATLLVLPLGLLSFTQARGVWLIASCIAVAAAWRSTRVSPQLQAATAPLWIFGLSLGALEPAVFLLLALALQLEARAPLRAAVLIGLAAAIKVYPVLLFAGLLLGRRWRPAFAGLAAGVAVTLLSDALLGGGALAAWLRYTPQNVARYVDVVGSAAPVRLLRAAAPGLSPTLAALLVLVALVAPLLPALLRAAGWRPLVPVMLLGSPLLAPHYVAMVVLAPVGRAASVCLAWAGGCYLLARLGVMPLTAASEPFVILPLLAGLLLCWGGVVARHTATPRPPDASGTGREETQNVLDTLPERHWL